MSMAGDRGAGTGWDSGDWASGGEGSGGWDSGDWASGGHSELWEDPELDDGSDWDALARDAEEIPLPEAGGAGRAASRERATRHSHQASGHRGSRETMGIPSGDLPSDRAGDHAGSDSAGGAGGGTAEQILAQLHALLRSAKAMPLSASVLVSRDEALELIESAMASLPREIEEARRLLRDRSDYLERAERSAEQIIEDARIQAEHLIERTEIVRQANHLAQRMRDEAMDDAHRMRTQAEDYCDRRLAAFQIVLERTLATVSTGRARLQAALAPALEEERSAESDVAEDGGFFDQDRLDNGAPHHGEG